MAGFPNSDWQSRLGLNPGVISKSISNVFNSRLKMIVREIVVPLLTMTHVSTTSAVVDIVRFIFRIYLK